MPHTKTYLLNSLAGNAMPLSHGFVAVRRKQDVAYSLWRNFGHYIASTVALGQRFWA